MQSSPPCLMAEQSNTKRRCVHAADRLGDLPDCLLHHIISSLGSRQAVQTTVLSRRWRHLWRDMPCVAIDEREFAGEPWERFEDFADHTLTRIPPETRLESFRMHLVSSNDTAGRWVRRGLRNLPVTVEICVPLCSTVGWRPCPSYCSYPGRQQRDLSVTGQCAAGFTRRLTTLRLVGVTLTSWFVEDFGRHCPALEELHMERCFIREFSAIASPTLRSLVVVEAQHSAPCAHLTVRAPRLSYLRLEIFYNGEDCSCTSKSSATAEEAAPEPESLASLAEASIRLTETGPHRQRDNRVWRKREFLKSMRRFLDVLPNVTRLHLAGFTMTALLDEESQGFPVLHSLKTLLLEECDVGLQFQAVTGILRSTHNLENLGLHHCKFLASTAKKRTKRGKQSSKRRTSAPPVFWCKNLKSIDIERRQEDAPELLEVLSIISEGMPPAQWRLVKTSTTVVQRTG